MPSNSKVDKPDCKFKVIVIGDSSKYTTIDFPYGDIILIIGVGKTSILNRFLYPEKQVKCMYMCMHYRLAVYIITIYIL